MARNMKFLIQRGFFSVLLQERLSPQLPDRLSYIRSDMLSYDRDKVLSIGQESAVLDPKGFSSYYRIHCRDLQTIGETVPSAPRPAELEPRRDVVLWQETRIFANGQEPAVLEPIFFLKSYYRRQCPISSQICWARSEERCCPATRYSRRPATCTVRSKGVSSY